MRWVIGLVFVCLLPIWAQAVVMIRGSGSNEPSLEMTDTREMLDTLEML